MEEINLSPLPSPLPAPELSIVVAAHNSPDALAACLAALRREIGGDRSIEVLVCRRSDGHAAPPDVRCISLPNGSGVPALRHAGLAAAEGTIVAFLEDHLRPVAGWLAALRRAHRDAPAALAIGGPIDPVDTGSAVDWAAFFCEYGWYLSPLPAGPARLLSAANASYKRGAATRFAPLGAVWETRWHAELGPGALRAEPAMGVLHERRFHAVPFLVERFRYGREYARSRPGSRLERLGRAVAAPLLPLLLCARLAAVVAARRRHRLRFAASLPWLLLFLAAWSLGEAAGYLAPRENAWRG